MAPKQPRHARPMNGREATIRDVASKAGVSVATVSRVLNDKQVVRESTREAVTEAARTLRYVPNVAARSLSVRRSHTIGVLLPEVHGEFFSEVIRGVDAEARATRYHILVSGWHSDRDEMLEVLDAMRGRVDGILLMAPDLGVAGVHEQLPTQLPIVLLNSTDREHDTVNIDNYGGSQAMMRHLIALGHQSIAFLKGPSRNLDSRERLRGYRMAMRKAGGRTLELDGDFSEESGHLAAQAIAGMASRPSAVFAANDSMAAGLIDELTRLGVRVPDDVAVAGFDDIPVARYMTPPLTTVHVDIADLGRRAFNILLQSLDARAADKRREAVSTSLVIRRSCGAGGHTQISAVTAKKRHVARRRS